MRFVADLLLDLKVATLTLISGASLSIADYAFDFESALPSMAGFVAIVTGIIVGASHYFKLMWDNRHARAKARLDELEIEQEVKDSRLKDLLIREQELKNTILEKQAKNNDEL